MSSTGHPKSKPKKSGVVIPHEATLLQRFVAFAVWVFVRLVTVTVRFRWDDRSRYFDNPPAHQAIYACWHNRLALSMPLYFIYIKRRTNTAGLAGLVSASKDGGFLAAIMERFGLLAVRGSSSRRGPQALLELTTHVERGYDIALTPDGPRGPCYTVREGAIALAQITGLPIVPVSYHLNWKVCVRSWDRFQIPMPFTRCEVTFGEPVRVPRETDDKQRESLRLRLENNLKNITRD